MGTVGPEVVAMACQAHCWFAHHLFGAMPRQAANCMQACPTTCIFWKCDATTAENVFHKKRHQPTTTQELQTMGWGQQTGPLKSDEQGCGGKKKSPNPFFWLSKNSCCQIKRQLQKRNRHTRDFFIAWTTPSNPHCPHPWPCKRFGAKPGCVGCINFCSINAAELVCELHKAG